MNFQLAIIIKTIPRIMFSVNNFIYAHRAKW